MRDRLKPQLDWPDDAFDIAEDIPCPFCPGSFAHARAPNRGCYTAHTEPACERFDNMSGQLFVIQAVDRMRERGMVPPNDGGRGEPN